MQVQTFYNFNFSGFFGYDSPYTDEFENLLKRGVSRPDLFRLVQKAHNSGEAEIPITEHFTLLFSRVHGEWDMNLCFVRDGFTTVLFTVRNNGCSYRKWCEAINAALLTFYGEAA